MKVTTYRNIAVSYTHLDVYKRQVVTYDDLVKLGSVAAAKEAGVYRSEGKDYVMKDGDVVLFRFNV